MSNNLYVNLHWLKGYLNRHPQATAADMYAEAQDEAVALYLSWSADDIEVAGDFRPGSVPIVLHEKIMVEFDNAASYCMSQLSDQLSDIAGVVLQAHGISPDSLRDNYEDDDDEDDK